MKSSLFFLMFFAISGVAVAQTQTLPDIRVTGDSGVKSYLYKRSLLYNTQILNPDSLPPFTTGLDGPTKVLKPKPKHAKYHCYIQLEGSSEFAANGFVSVYPGIKELTGINNYFSINSPESNKTSTNNKLFVGVMPVQKLPLTFSLDFFNTNGPGFDSKSLDVGIAHFRPELDLLKAKINSLHIQMSYGGIDQQNTVNSYKRSYFNHQISSIVSSGWLNTKLKFLGQSGESGILLAPKIGHLSDYIDNLRFHVLADANSLIPSLEFDFKHIMSEGSLFYLKNKPSLSENGISSIFDESTPWIFAGDNHKLKKTPLDLQAGLELTYPSETDFSLKRLNITNTTTYHNQSPVLESGLNYGIAELIYTDVFTNSSAIGAFFNLDELNIHQGLDLTLSYLTRKSMIRAPYTPVLALKTNARYTWNSWIMGLNLRQNYFTKDHNGINLPESVVLDLGIDYVVANSSVYCQLSNLFDQDEWGFSELSSRGRTVLVGARHRF